MFSSSSSRAAPARTAPSNLGNVLSQILLCKQISPDFQQEELCSISKDAQELNELLDELQAHLPDPKDGEDGDDTVDEAHNCE